MAATLMDGKALAQQVRAEVAREVEELGRPVGLATVLVGDDPASAVYVRNKRQACAEAGIESFHHELSAETSQEELLSLVADLNADDRVTGILVQLPCRIRSTRTRSSGRSTRRRTSTGSIR